MDLVGIAQFKGVARSSSIRFEAGGVARLVNLPDQPCRAVKLSRWNASDDENFTVIGPDFLDTDNEIYYGFGGEIAHQLFISQGTELLPVNNLNQVTIRVPAKVGACVVHYSWFE